MSRPIFSRPRTRVYGCNYDKGESYYKPMVDHLDRKYSGRPLFPEPRTSFADEIAARRSDIGSRNLSGPMSELLDDDYDSMWDGYGRRIPEEEVEEDFVSMQRRLKKRASDTFEEDLAELRRRRRDLQDRLFDMVDIGTEIERAKQTLTTANTAFEKHAMKFDNKEKEKPDEQPSDLVARLEKSRKLQLSREQESTDEKKANASMIKWSKYSEMRDDMPKLIGDKKKTRLIRLKSPIPLDDATIAPEIAANQDKPVEKRRKKRSLLKRKKSLAI